MADFFEFAELLVMDALERDESCGGHFRDEHDDEGEAKRNDEKFSHVVGVGSRAPTASKPVRHKEPLVFEAFKPSVRSYK